MNIIKNIFMFYYNWFKDLTNTSKKLWFLIFLKTVIIATVLVLYFPDILNNYKTDMDKADFVADNLLKTNP